MSPRLVFTTAIAALALFSGLGTGTPNRKPSRVATPAPGQIAEGPPKNPRYVAGVRQGLDGDLVGARKSLERLATETPEPNTAAWSLYQAALAAKASNDPAGHRELLARLQREHPGHSPTLRTATVRHSGVRTFRHPGETEKAGASDCGPRALAWMLRKAGKNVDPARLTRECGTRAKGTTLLKLRDAARKYGRHAEGRRSERTSCGGSGPAGSRG